MGEARTLNTTLHRLPPGSSFVSNREVLISTSTTAKITTALQFALVPISKKKKKKSRGADANIRHTERTMKIMVGNEEERNSYSYHMLLLLLVMTMMMIQRVTCDRLFLSNHNHRFNCSLISHTWSADIY